MTHPTSVPARRFSSGPVIALMVLAALLLGACTVILILYTGAAREAAEQTARADALAAVASKSDAGVNCELKTTGEKTAALTLQTAIRAIQDAVKSGASIDSVGPALVAINEAQSTLDKAASTNCD